MNSDAADLPETRISQLTISPPQIAIHPHKREVFNVEFTGTNVGAFRSAIEAHVLGGDVLYLSARAQVEMPRVCMPSYSSVGYMFQVCLLESRVNLDGLYVGAAKSVALHMKNLSLLPVRFGWDETTSDGMCHMSTC